MGRNYREKTNMGLKFSFTVFFSIFVCGLIINNVHKNSISQLIITDNIARAYENRDAADIMFATNTTTTVEDTSVVENIVPDATTVAITNDMDVDSVETYSTPLEATIEFAQAVTNSKVFRDIAKKAEIKAKQANNEVILTHKIQQGDTLSDIAELYGIPLSKLREYNPNLKATNLRVGKIVNLRETEASLAAKTKKDTPTKSNTTVAKTTNNTNTPARVTVGKVSDSSKSFRYPVAFNGVTSGYGRRYHPVLKRYIAHAGIDLRAKFVNLSAARGGKVTFAGTQPGYGRIIIISHSGGFETRYAHLNKINVKVGQTVSAGQSIGQTGNSGRSTGPHLHFEIRKDGKTVNPMQYLR